jgi:hypothetical protein
LKIKRKSSLNLVPGALSEIVGNYRKLVSTGALRRQWNHSPRGNVAVLKTLKAMSTGKRDVL